MLFHRLTLIVAVALLFFLGVSCSISPKRAPSPVREGSRAAPDRLRHDLTLDAIMEKPPDLSWERSSLEAKSNYLAFPGTGERPGFYLSKNGFHCLDPDNFALSYEKTGDGFTLIEIKKREGRYNLPECPVIYPSDRCAEDHALMIVTRIDCSDRCKYTFTVYDYFSPIRILQDEAALIGLMRSIVHGRSTHIPYEVKHDESGKLGEDRRWAMFIQSRFDFITNTIKASSHIHDLRMKSSVN